MKSITLIKYFLQLAKLSLTIKNKFPLTFVPTSLNTTSDNKRTILLWQYHSSDNYLTMIIFKQPALLIVNMTYRDWPLVPSLLVVSCGNC